MEKTDMLKGKEPQFSGWKKAQGDTELVISENDARDFIQNGFRNCPNCGNKMHVVYDYGDLLALKCDTPGCRTEVNATKHY